MRQFVGLFRRLGIRGLCFTGLDLIVCLLSAACDGGYQCTDGFPVDGFPVDGQMSWLMKFFLTHCTCIRVPELLYDYNVLSDVYINSAHHSSSTLGDLRCPDLYYSLQG